jgi:predicted nucleic acid-binding protein
MGDRVVIDASVAMALLVAEKQSDVVRSATAAWSGAGIELVVPSHFWVEVSNSLVRRHSKSTGAAIAGLVLLDELGLLTIDLDRPTLLLALDQMATYGLSAYDAVYLALARATDAQLATLDRRLAEAAGVRGLLIGDDEPRRLSDGAAEYEARRERASPWAHTAAVGAHIADLRRQALTAER